MPGWDFAYVQDDVNPRNLRILEGTFLRLYIKYSLF